MRILVSSAAAAVLLIGAAFGGSSAANAESVMSACAAQWKEAQAAGTTGGATWPQFLARCKMQPSTVSTAPAPQPAQPGWVFPWQQPQAPAQTAAPAPSGAGQFRTDAEARIRCPTDKVVWVNTRSKIYHYQGTRNYGTTKEGAYMCEADAKAAGDRAARTIVHHHYQG